MADTALVVPMQCNALVVNKGVLARDTFRWWQFNYLSLTHFKSPEPEAFDRSVGGQQPGVYLQWTLPRALRHNVQSQQTSEIEYPLVPNRWLIVRFSGTTQRQATAWVLESDCPFTDQVHSTDSSQTSLYLADPDLIRMWKSSSDPYRNHVALDPNSTTVQVAKIGVRFPLQGWTERAADTMFLTAVAPANPVFSAYYPHNIGVFSFFDDLSGIDQDTLSYMVLGWYSNPQKDILAAWQQDTSSQHPYQDLLTNLEWTVDGGSEAQATTSLYEAAVFSIQWDRNGEPPSNDPLQAIRDSGKLNVAIGNTTIDAFTALIEQQLQDSQKANLLRAFQYDFLQVLNQVNGDALLQEEIHQAWFGSKPGGYWWTIVPQESDGSATVDLTADEAQWLLQLNLDQAALDDALDDLFSLQWKLNALWYKSGFLADPNNTFPQPPAGIPAGGLQQFQNQLAAELDPTRPGSTASLVIKQIQVVKDSLAKVPQPDWSKSQNAQDAFQSGILEFAQKKGLADSKVLKAVAAPRFWQPNDPVIIVSGVEPPAASDPDQSLDVRLATHLITSFTAGGKPVNSSTAGSVIPSIGSVSSLPAAVPSLVAEFFLLDPSNAASIAGAIGRPVSQVSDVMKAHAASTYHGTLPDLDLQNWTQPWSPMFVEWKAKYVHIPYGTDANRNWTFDGTDYHFTPDSGSPAFETRDVGGVSLLSPHAQFVFGSRLQDFINKYGSGTELASLYDWIKQVYQWKFLAQELTGFNQSLALRDSRAYRRPSPNDTLGTGANQYPLADLIGYTRNGAPTPYSLPDAYQGQVNTVPYIPNGPAIPFHGVRQGQLYFTALNLYDEFGRLLYVIESGSSTGLFDYKNFPLLLDDALEPGNKVDPNIASIAQLPPRMLQHSRLDFRLLDGKDDTKVLGLAPGVNPICGWVLPNHPDDSILLYAPDGTSLGEFRLVETPQGTKVGEWQAPPHSSVTTLDNVAAVAPHLKQMLDAAAIKQEANFRAFLLAIDETLWTIDPLGSRVDQNLSVLVGRPLALVRARLQFQLDGQPLNDTGWASTFNPAQPEFLTYKFAIRLGDQATRQDGVIGYFEQNYEAFNSVVQLDASISQNYIKPIGPLGATGGANYIELDLGASASVTLLVDPRASIHAVTGILPVKEMDIPPQFVGGPLANMEVSFRMGPILTLIQPTPSQGGIAPQYPEAITYPLPAEQNGAWSWWEKDASSGNWNGYDLIDATSNAQLKPIPNTLREGFLQFIVNLKKDS